MASNIDDTKPEAVNPTTSSVRTQFTTAKTEITALQAFETSLGSSTVATQGHALVGTTSDLAADVATIGAAEITITIATSLTVTSNLTIPSNIHIEFLRGGEINIDGGVVVTMEGTLDAKPWRIFSGGGQIIFTGAIKEIYVEWWGAKADGIIYNLAAFDSAVASGGITAGETTSTISRGYKIQLLRGRYLMEGEWRIDRTFAVKGAGGWSGFVTTELLFDAGTHGVTFIRHAGGLGGDFSGTPSNPDRFSLAGSFENIKVRAVSKSGAFNGLNLTTVVAIIGVSVADFSGHGIYIQSAISTHSKAWADPPGSEMITSIPPSLLGGSSNFGGGNGWWIERTLVTTCTLDGLHIVGGDANQGTSINLTAQTCRVGLSDQSGIGCTHINFLPEACSLAAYRTFTDAGAVMFINCNFSEGNGPDNIASDGTLFLNCHGGNTVLAGEMPIKNLRAAGGYVTIPTLYAQNNLGTKPTQGFFGNVDSSNAQMLFQTDTAGSIDANSTTRWLWNVAKGAWQYQNVGIIAAFDLYTNGSPQFKNMIGAPSGVVVGAGKAVDIAGTGSPEGIKIGANASTYRNTNGGAGTSLYVKETTSIFVITAATQANPVVVTATASNVNNGDIIRISGVVGMVEINNLEFTAANATANTVELSGIDGTAYTAYTSAGVLERSTGWSGV